MIKNIKQAGIDLDKPGLLNKIKDFIGKDTMAENESKKLVVVIRIFLWYCWFYVFSPLISIMQEK